MPVASSQYWNSIHGREPGEAQQDAEGLQTMRTLARNMAFLMKSIALGKEQYGLPEKEPACHTKFVRYENLGNLRPENIPECKIKKIYCGAAGLEIVCCFRLFGEKVVIRSEKGIYRIKKYMLKDI